MAADAARNTRILAVCGKGGVGKTSISAALVRGLLAGGSRKILAIDADPAVGLATALGMNVEKTLDDVRNSLIDRLESGAKEDRRDLVSLLDYEVFGALVESGGLAFLAIGRPETEGCYCQINDILKDIIGSIAGSFDYVVIDGEAGIEQVNRRVMETVTDLLLVSDASAKGLNVVRTIRDVSARLVEHGRAWLMLNRIRGAAELDRLALPDGMDLLGWVPEDENVRLTDIEGGSLLAMRPGPALEAVAACLPRLESAGTERSGQPLKMK
ncbi:MAG TPA: AAA family ATPase [Spirochaetota bacterium]|nr:AAA family ATPase [Spirochaetota bacterium]HOD16697.1 AAA family ATPase [Spirochaetota bacterium]HPN11265.1 AAA family ATPase [Spirochaetota bacterium]